MTDSVFGENDPVSEDYSKVTDRETRRTLLFPLPRQTVIGELYSTSAFPVIPGFRNAS